MEVIHTGDQQEKVTVITYVCRRETFITFCICSIQDFELVCFNQEQKATICIKLFIVENSITSIHRCVDDVWLHFCISLALTLFFLAVGRCSCIASVAKLLPLR